MSADSQNPYRKALELLRETVTGLHFLGNIAEVEPYGESDRERIGALSDKLANRISAYLEAQK